MLLTEPVHTSGLGHHLKQTLAGWKKPFTIHDPGKFLTDIAITLALGGDTLSDSSTLRSMASDLCLQPRWPRRAGTKHQEIIRIR